MTVDAYEEALRWAEHWSQRWFLGDDGEDRLVGPEGVEAGWATHVEAYLILLDVALDHLGVRRPPQSFVGRAKARGWDRAVRAGALGLVAHRGLRSRESARPVAIVTEIPTPSMIEPAMLVAAALGPGSVSVAAADPRAWRRLRRAGLDPHALTLPLTEQRRALRRFGRAYDEVLRAVTGRPPPMILRGADLAAASMAALGRSLAHSLPWLAVEFGAVSAYADRTNARAFAVASDQHRMGRLVVHAARSRGAGVLVLQHGMPQSKIGYLPVVADKVATWSPRASEWFVERGTHPDRLEIVGNPRFDTLVRPEHRDRPPDGPVAMRTLLALSPTELRTNRRVVATVVRAVARLRDVELVIKLHPGHREWGWVSEEIRAAADGRSVRVEHRADIAPLLRWADVTLVHRSSVAVESLVARRPVIAVASDLPSVADAELADLALPHPSTAGELAATIEALRSPESRADWIARRAERIGFHAGPAGNSARRIADALLDPNQTFASSGGSSASSQRMG